MSKGKKVKPTQPPSFKESITLENIGKFIKSRRTQQGLNTLDTVMLCNISAHTLNKIENGFEDVRLNTLLQIMKALGMEMNMKELLFLVTLSFPLPLIPSKKVPS